MRYVLRFFFLIFILIEVKKVKSNSQQLSVNKTKHRFARIINGYQPKNPILAKHIVSLRYGPDKGIYGSNHMCCGCILSERAILTAAHCVRNKDDGTIKKKKHLRIFAGGRDRIRRSGTEQIIEVSKILTYPRYSNETGFGDIAILHLKTRIVEDGINIKSIAVTNKLFTPGQDCVALGWGTVVYNGPLADGVVFMNVSIFPFWYCSLLTEIMKEILCVGEIFGPLRFAGSGDSGGPLICNGTLGGVASFIVGGRTFYSSVYYFREWIEANSKSRSVQNLKHTKILIASLIVIVMEIF